MSHSSVQGRGRSSRRHRATGVPAWRLKSALGWSAMVLGFIWLAWQVLMNVAAHAPLPASAAANPEYAATTRAAALVRLADRHVGVAGADANWAAVERVAVSALAANPLEGRALVLLALVAEARGDEERAAELMEQAAARSLRDAHVHLWMFRQRLVAGDYGQAARHADMVLRVRPRLRDELVEPLTALALHPEGVPALAAVLGEAPPWRGWFLREFGGGDASAPSALYLALHETPAPPTNRELGWHLDRLIASGRVAQAYLLWQRFLPEERLADGRYLHNAGFEHEPSGLAFDWRIGSVRGADTAIVRDTGLETRRLRVDFGRGRVAFRHVEKLMMLPPGTYRLSGQAETRALDNARGLHWRVSCVGGDELAATERLSGTHARHGFAETFTVPASGCRAQRLRLELAARVALEREVGGGSAWYDSLELERVGRPSRPELTESGT